MHLSFFGSATMTSRSGLRVTGVVSGPLPLHLLVSMIWKAHLPFFWKTVQGSGVVFEETRNILFCCLRYTKRGRLLGRVCVHGWSDLVLRGRSLW
jgi:hypothetical protein